jgi:hypothetical protein
VHCTQTWNSAAQCVLPVTPAQSVSASQPHAPVAATQAVPVVLVVQSLADAHCTQMPAVVSQTLASAPVQSVDVMHSTQVSVDVLQILASAPMQSVDAVHSTHIMLVVSQTRSRPIVQVVLDVHAATQAFVVRLQTWFAPQFELATQATHLSALEQCGRVDGHVLSAVHSTQAPDEQVVFPVIGQFVSVRHWTQVPRVVSQYGVPIGHIAPVLHATAAAASDEPGEPDEPEPEDAGVPEEDAVAPLLDPEPDGAPDDPPPEELVLVAVEPLDPLPEPPSPPPGVDPDEPPQATTAPTEMPIDQPSRLRKTAM